MSWRTSIRLRSLSAQKTPRISVFAKSPPLCPNYGSVSRLTIQRDVRRGVKTRTIVQSTALPLATKPSLPAISQEFSASRLSVVQGHLKNVRDHPDCVVLTRVGDFYELYGPQVDQYAPLLNLKKARKASDDGDVAMAGFQYTQLDRYLKMLVQDLGKQVAISEQFLIPEEARVKTGGPAYYRKVTRVITPGTLIDETFVDPFENNYLLAICTNNESSLATSSAGMVGLSWVDVSSGEFFVQSCTIPALPSLIARIGPREVVLDTASTSEHDKSVRRQIEELGLVIREHQSASLASNTASRELKGSDPTADHSRYNAVESASIRLVVDYVRDKLLDLNVALQTPVRRTEDECMMIDKQSLRNLEIRTTMRDGYFKGTLLHTIRQTVTKSGARLLQQRLVAPSLSLAVINARLDLVDEFLGNNAVREDVIALLKRTADTYRLLSKFSIGKGSADDLLDLANTIEISQLVGAILQDHLSTNQAMHQNVFAMRQILTRLNLDAPAGIARTIREAIDEDGLNRHHLAEHAADDVDEASEDPVSEFVETDSTMTKATLKKKSPKKINLASSTKAEDIWIMRKDASPALALLHSHVAALFDERDELTERLRTELKAESLTLRWSSQLQHFCHVKGRDAQGTIARLEGARIISASKSTRSFAYPAWTSLGKRLDQARRQIRVEEQAMFEKLRSLVLESLSVLRQNAAVLDELDVACSSAVVAKTLHLVRPILNEGTSHKIIGGRHPTVDNSLREQGRHFTSNDCTVGHGEKIYLITGPNMAGKSTYLRQNALITILAQTGCYVPAQHAEVGLVDKIFSRVGSADNLYQDQSTFMVEMLETADILKQATPRSFVIMDEVGRGTTPEDGVAVGYACLHHLQYVNKCRSLFATHFHPLADMTRDFPDVACHCTDVVEEEDGSWSYMHKVRKGVNRDSHALKVARLAGMPESAIRVAEDVLADLQQQYRGNQQERAGAGRDPSSLQNVAAAT